MERTPNSDKPGPREIEVYGSLQAKATIVGLALFLTMIFGPIPITITLIAFLVGTVFSGGRIVIDEGTLWQWPIMILCCVLAVPLHRLWNKLMRQLRELREQMD